MSTTPPLPDALPGRRERIDGRAGPLAVYVDGEGPPLVLVHSINAAASAFEIEPVYLRMRERFTVFAPDLPGFGHSDRSERRYDPELFTTAVQEVVAEARRATGAPAVHALALSLSAEFLARAAVRQSEAFCSIALVTPTGFDRRASRRPRDASGDREVPGLHAVLTLPLWKKGLFGLLTRPGTIRYFLKRTFGGPTFDERLARYDEITARQPGAEHAPFAFLAGRLFSLDAPQLYRQLPGPVWLAHGTRGDFADFSGVDWARERPEWRVDAFDTGALPHFEDPERFFARYDAFLASAGAPAPPGARSTDPVAGSR